MPTLHDCITHPVKTKQGKACTHKSTHLHVTCQRCPDQHQKMLHTRLLESPSSSSTIRLLLLHNPLVQAHHPCASQRVRRLAAQLARPFPVALYSA